MSIVEKVIAAITPSESIEERSRARAHARAAAKPGDWLTLILDHHVALEDAFSAVKAASDSGTRLEAQKKLGVLLTGHAGAEESVIYPALAQANEKGHAEMGYNEQAIVKMEMAELEHLDPMSREYLDKVEHIREAVAHHMFEEEGTWFLDLQKGALPADQAKLTQRYTEEFERYAGRV